MLPIAEPGVEGHDWSLSLTIGSGRKPVIAAHIRRKPSSLSRCDAPFLWFLCLLAPGLRGILKKDRTGRAPTHSERFAAGESPAWRLELTGLLCFFQPTRCIPSSEGWAKNLFRNQPGAQQVTVPAEPGLHPCGVLANKEAICGNRGVRAKAASPPGACTCLGQVTSLLQPRLLATPPDQAEPG